MPSFQDLSAQSYQEKLKELYISNDTAGQTALLRKWESAPEKSAEFYLAAFNHQMRKSAMYLMRASQSPSGGMNQNGYMEGVSESEDPYFEKGLEYGQKGLENYPNRLDIRLYKIQALGKRERYDEFTADILQMIEQSAVNKNKWVVSDNKPVPESQKAFFSSIQEFVVQLYSTNDLVLLDHMKNISQTVLKHYPDQVESLSNLSIVYLYRKQYDRALDVLLRAEKQVPKDAVVLSNIAQAYKGKEDSTNAVVYYQKILAVGDAQQKRYAEEQIQALKKK